MQPLHHSTLNGQSQTDGQATENLEAQRSRLESEIASAKARAIAARERTANHERQVQEALRIDLAASKKYLAEMEEQHNRAIAETRSAAQAEVDRVVGAAAHQGFMRVNDVE